MPKMSAKNPETCRWRSVGLWNEIFWRAMNPQRTGSERVSRLLPPAFEFCLFVIFFYLWAYIMKHVAWIAIKRFSAIAATG